MKADIENASRLWGEHFAQLHTERQLTAALKLAVQERDRTISRLTRQLEAARKSTLNENTKPAPRLPASADDRFRLALPTFGEQATD